MASGPARQGADTTTGVLRSIGSAAQATGVSERALRYYQQLGLITPSGRTPGGMRRYSDADLARVRRIRELQSLLGLNLDEIAVVLRNDDRMAEIRAAYHDRRTTDARRRRLAAESLELHERLRATVEDKQAALASFHADIDARIARIHVALAAPAGRGTRATPRRPRAGAPAAPARRAPTGAPSR